MKQIQWNITVDTIPVISRYCKKCGGKTSFLCSKRFRINAQQRNLDIWLIYKCRKCDTTWNAEIYSRIPPQKISSELLERFHRNDAQLAKEYSLDPQFLQKNDIHIDQLEYSVSGPDFDMNDTVMLTIHSLSPLPVRVSRIIREKLGLSQKEYLALIDTGRLRSEPEKDLRKCRLGTGIKLIFKAAEQIKRMENHA